MAISAFIGLIGLWPASRVFTCSLLDRLLLSYNLHTKMPPLYDLVFQNNSVFSPRLFDVVHLLGKFTSMRSASWIGQLALPESMCPTSQKTLRQLRVWSIQNSNQTERQNNTISHKYGFIAHPLLIYQSPHLSIEVQDIVSAFKSFEPLHSTCLPLPSSRARRMASRRRAPPPSRTSSPATAS